MIFVKLRVVVLVERALGVSYWTVLEDRAEFMKIDAGGIRLVPDAV